MQQSAAESHAQVLSETHNFYRMHHDAFHNRGYHIMYGPLTARPPILFVGYQPGGDHRTADHTLISPAHSPPEACFYATEEWRLASRMRQMWGKAYLESCTGMNAIFFRSPKIQVYENEVPPSVRQAAIQFCLPRVQRLVDAIEPTGVVFIGLQSLRLFGETNTELANAIGRILVESGYIGSVKAYSTLHLSGARISAIDRQSIADFVRDLGKVL